MSEVALVCVVAAVLSSAPWVGSGRPGAGRARRLPPAVDPAPHGRAAVGIDEALLLDVVDAALSAGAPIPRALQAVGELMGGPVGAVLVRAGGALVLGASWSAAWSGSPAAVRDLADGLEPAWTSGVAPGPALRARAARIRAERRSRTRAAAATLGVHLVLPLGLCFLPAFVLLGLVPLVFSLAAGLLG
ncbi:type II secretion system F family protein [Cellulomonas rhizosphaerae]|uniref:Secretion system protein n=1 Tax=Cellulomonas rhizosphaerae TaxID=2293719 RepID=A0A413RI58_9CELL|nr:type II secretion system F family protein [Cellulomonas rhizosphaerae]RHA37991.1 secretion system protein [Cellulomonas rhizosphaerae]